jgi:hypothetical protein
MTTSCDGKFHKVEVSMNEYKLKYPMYVMTIRGVDIVLGGAMVSHSLYCWIKLTREIYNIL